MINGTRVKIVNFDCPSYGLYGTIIPLEDLPPWAVAYIKLDNGGSYCYASYEIETV